MLSWAWHSLLRLFISTKQVLSLSCANFTVTDARFLCLIFILTGPWISIPFGAVFSSHGCGALHILSHSVSVIIVVSGPWLRLGILSLAGEDVLPLGRPNLTLIGR